MLDRAIIVPRLAENRDILLIPVFQGEIVGDWIGCGWRCGIGDFEAVLGMMGIGNGEVVMSNGWIER